MKHSRGPWKDNGRMPLTPAYVQVAAPAGIVAKVWVGNEFQTDHEEGQANLRLILKAPELLAALQETISWQCPTGISDACWECGQEEGCPLLAAQKLVDEIAGKEKPE